MSSDRYSQEPIIPPAALPPIRLEMKGQGSTLGHVDGGWWPHSYDAAAEFPQLIDALSARAGRVERIGYDMDAWHSVRRKLIHDGEIVRCEGFRTVFADTVNIVSITGQQIRLLVVPPQAGADIAEAALHAASALTSVRTPRDILTAAGPPVGSLRPATTVPAGQAAATIHATGPR
jgi:hypothetical protein